MRGERVNLRGERVNLRDERDNLRCERVNLLFYLGVFRQVIRTWYVYSFDRDKRVIAAQQVCYILVTRCVDQTHPVGVT